MSNTKTRTLPQRKTAYGRGSEAYHFRMDPETRHQLKEAGAWFETRSLSYSDSVLIRTAIRDLLAHLQGADPEEFGGIVERVELASGVVGRRVR